MSARALAAYRRPVAPLELLWPLDATYGAEDQSGNNRDGTGSGGISIGAFADSPLDLETHSTDFAGDDDLIASTFAAVAASGVRTMIGWAYRDASATTDVLWGTDHNQGPVLRLVSGSQDVVFRPTANSSTNQRTWSGAWPGNAVWTLYELVLDRDANTVELYLDLELISSQVLGAYTTTAGLFRLGNSSAATSNPFDGKMAWSGLYTGRLSRAEARDIFLLTRPVRREVKPDPSLSVEIETTESDHYYLSADTLRGEDRPSIAPFRTQRQDGFADGGFSLSRKITQDWPELGLINTVRLVGRDGSIAYEGRIFGTPRSNEGGDSIEVTLQGWMAHSRDRRFREIYACGDRGRWQEPGAQRKLDVVSVGYAAKGFNVVNDEATPSISLEHEGEWNASHRPACEAWFDAMGIPLGSLYFPWKRGPNLTAGPDNWVWQAVLSLDDTASAFDTSGDLQAAGPGSGTLEATGDRRYAMLQLSYASGGGGTEGKIFGVLFTCPVIYGAHGLEKHGEESATQGKGFYGSDIIRDIATRFCPRFSVEGIEDTSYPILEAAFIEAVHPYEGFDYVNRHHFWELDVFEGPTLHFRPADLTKADWEVRMDEGARFTPQGDSLEDFASGVEVTYTDLVTGSERFLSPDDYPELRDDDESNPANKADNPLYIEHTIPHPTTEGDALQSGRAALAEFNRPKAPGTIKVVGHIRDAQGNWQPAWKVRDAQTIAIADHPNDAPRLVTNTTYDPATLTCEITVDGQNKKLEALYNRVATRRVAAGFA